MELTFVIRSICSIYGIVRVSRVNGQIFRNLLISRFSKRTRITGIVNYNGGSNRYILIEPVSVTHSQTNTSLRSLLTKEIVFMSREVSNTSKLRLRQRVE